jgi:nitrite reductase/ring-hydroxylating ferredoxin subunit/DMSO/TMAO reductase YedYZ heme-binding membrane subunit
MSVQYRAVNWNRQKRLYDGWLAAAILAALLLFVAATMLQNPDATIETALIRGLGFVAILLLHLILAIGPLARLDRRWLPLLYNRRHLGVTMAGLALAHATFAIVQYHALGNLNPLVSVLTSNGDYGFLPQFPFELFGIISLGIIVLLAATSHDFWLSVLTPPAWKRLHMLVYLAYLSLLAHVGLGIVQADRSVAYPILFGMGALFLGAIHFAAARRERRIDRSEPPASDDWVPIVAAAAIPEGRARIGVVGGERVAVFKHGNRLSCVSNVCRHQNGPLGEGRIIDGCITCPWHGYQYRPEDGRSPPPFDDRIATYNLRLRDGMVYVHRVPNPPGTRVDPLVIGAPPS